MNKLSIKEIKDLVCNEGTLTEEIFELLAQDERVGVQQIYKQIINRRKKTDLERQRTYEMYHYEREALEQGLNYIVGIDEVGRGPLAGPVVAAAVILPTNEMIIGLDDSKKISADKRLDLNAKIKEKALGYAYGIAEPEEIDEINIYQATVKAMERAVENLTLKADLLLIDAVKLSNLPFRQISIIGGDGKSASIAAASIIAKVYRDLLMESYHEKYPQYGFSQNKGYGTKEHIEAIVSKGYCPLHRRSFNVPGFTK